MFDSGAMNIFGYDVQSVYLIGLIIMGCLTIVHVLFGDVFEGVMAGASLQITLVLSFFAILSGIGCIFEYITNWSSVVIFIVSALLSFIAVFLIKMFVLIPLSRAEQNTAYSMGEFTGQMGEVILTIPRNGFGEVLLESKLGNNGMPAKCASNEELVQGSKVCVLDVRDGVLFVEKIDLYHT
ncbi:NfeD family protein [Microbacteriaceae bacterium 4G12]